jgi:hypothetical protein
MQTSAPAKFTNCVLVQICFDPNETIQNRRYRGASGSIKIHSQLLTFNDPLTIEKQNHEINCRRFQDAGQSITDRPLRFRISNDIKKALEPGKSAKEISNFAKEFFNFASDNNAPIHVIVNNRLSLNSLRILDPKTSSPQALASALSQSYFAALECYETHNLINGIRR